MHMRNTIKKISIINIYGFKFLSLSLSLSLSYVFILISFGYTHEFTLSFFFFCLLSVWWFIYIGSFIFCTLLTHLEQKWKKKNLNRALDAKLDNNWNPISFGYTHEFTLSFFFSVFVYWVFDGLFILDPSSFAPH